MKKLIEILTVITVAILFASFVAGLLTMGKVFQFEDYNIFSWAMFSCYYVFWITLALKLIIYEK